jgi:hypothetical protein
MNPIAAKNNVMVTFHLDDEECGSERLGSYGKFQWDDTPGFHWVAPHAVKPQVGLHELIVVPSKLLEYGLRYHIDDSAAIDKHLGDRLPVDVTLNVQWLQVLSWLFGLLEHDLLATETHLSDLLLGTRELDR